MERKRYIRPVTEQITIPVEQLMITASPGISEGGYDPSQPSDAKKHEFQDEDDWDDYKNPDLWDD